MADSSFAAEKPPFDFEQKNAPVTPPEESTSVPALNSYVPNGSLDLLLDSTDSRIHSAGADLTKPLDALPPQTNGDSTAQPHYLGLHPGLSSMGASESVAAPPQDAPAMEQPEVEQPVEHVAQGIQPVAAFIPEQREAPAEVEQPDPTATATVPPAIDQPVSDVRDEPTSQPPVLDSGIPHAPVEVAEPAAPSNSTPQVAPASLPLQDAQHTSDTAMEDTTVPEPVPVAATVDETLVEEAAAEPAVTDTAVGTQVEDATLAESVADVAPASAEPAAPTIIKADAEMVDAPAPSANGLVRPREEEESEEPAAKRTKTEEEPALESVAEFKKPELPALSTETAVPAPVEHVDTPALPTAPASTAPSIDDGPISPEQKKFLVELLRRTKKTKDAFNFVNAVDPVALSLPTYFDVVKEPMDLTTMETKLKGGAYPSVDAMIRDINTMTNNSLIFNGPAHLVTIQGGNLHAYMMKSIQTQLPRKGVTPAPAKPAKKEAAPTRPALPRRESRAVAQSPTGTARSPGAETYALQPDGTPLIRRDSTANDGRPKREIHRPQPRDLPYQTTRPKSKKHQTELKFCTHVMKELMKKEHQEYAWPFYDPVDPVALNIPSYHKVIKKPMDLGTVQSNLKNGQYSSGKEFKTDTELIFQNCFKFNPPTDTVHQLGKKLNSIFQDLWAQKDEWIREHSTPDTRSDEEDEDDEEEDEEEEEEAATNFDASRLANLQAQINALSAEMTSLVSGAAAATRKSPTAKPAKKSKKGGDTTATKKTKRSSSVANASAAAGKPEKKNKKPAKIPKLSQEQKREVSEGIGMLDDAGMRKAVQIIRNGVPSLQVCSPSPTRLLTSR